jgi:2-polyprenyl-6-hydroxyphenyl methylase/3-demethylubiquinone-9 3-methyltransferase
MDCEGQVIRGGEYTKRGDYHKHLDPFWPYASTYVLKMKFVRDYLDHLSPHHVILDAGCGEGVLVKEYRNKGRRIWGVDLGYGGPFVIPGNVVSLPFAEHTFDVALFLDVIEHLPFDSQLKAVTEIHRVLKPGGELLASIPNLAHLNSRLRFLLRGELHRTASVKKHPGDRPIVEYRQLLEEAGFTITGQRGLTPTIPLVVTWVVWKRPMQFIWLNRLLSRMMPAGWCLVNLITARREA